MSKLEKADYGKKLIISLSEQLTNEFGKGFSLSNLKLMRQFYLYMKSRISQTVSGQLPESILTGLAGANQFVLSWSVYVFLMGINDEKERSFYEIEALSQNWTVRELRRQFDSSLYERLA